MIVDRIQTKQQANIVKIFCSRIEFEHAPSFPFSGRKNIVPVLCSPEIHSCSQNVLHNECYDTVRVFPPYVCSAFQGVFDLFHRIKGFIFLPIAKIAFLTSSIEIASSAPSPKFYPTIIVFTQLPPSKLGSAITLFLLPAFICISHYYNLLQFNPLAKNVVDL